jgi:hypothetical protein
MRVKSLTGGGDNVVWLQWSRFKRREQSLFLFIWAAISLHVVFWVVWHFFIAPYPIALIIPLQFDLPSGLTWVHDYTWPIANSLILAVNIWLIFKIYKKDIFASWLLIGGNMFLQVLILCVTFYLASFSSPF